MSKLKDKVALITGSSSGVGKAIALELANQGVDIIINYKLPTSEDNARETAQKIREKGRKALFIQAVVNQSDEVNKMKEEILKEFTKVDILVNNACINKDMRFAKMDIDSWKAVLDSCLDSAFNCIKSFIDGMAERQWGRIVNISSIVGQKGNFGQANLATATAGLLGLTKSLAIEYAKSNVTVNAVAPGFLNSDINAHIVRGIPEDVIRNKILPMIPLGRIGRVEEVAEAVAFLCSADWITGQVIAINGGQYM